MNGLFLPSPDLLVKTPVERFGKMKKPEIVKLISEIRDSYTETNTATQLLCGSYLKELRLLSKPGIISAIREACEDYAKSSTTAELMTCPISKLRAMKKADLISYIAKAKEEHAKNLSEKEPCKRCHHHESTEDDATCAICMEGGSLHKLPCGHEFHASCSIEWFRKPISKGKCPVCRATPEGETPRESTLSSMRNSRERLAERMRQDDEARVRRDLIETVARQDASIEEFQLMLNRFLRQS